MFIKLTFKILFLNCHICMFIFEVSYSNDHLWIVIFELSPLNCLYLGLSLTVNCSTTDRQFSEFWRLTIKDFVFSVIVISYTSISQFNFSLFRIRLVCHLYVLKLKAIQFKTQTDDNVVFQIKIFSVTKVILIGFLLNIYI
jgi:hypothetical protein